MTSRESEAFSEVYPAAYTCLLCPGGGVRVQQSHPAQLLPHQTGQDVGGDRRADEGFKGTLHTLSAWWEHTHSHTQRHYRIFTIKDGGLSSWIFSCKYKSSFTWSCPRTGDRQNEGGGQWDDWLSSCRGISRVAVPLERLTIRRSRLWGRKDFLKGMRRSVSAWSVLETQFVLGMGKNEAHLRYKWLGDWVGLVRH